MDDAVIVGVMTEAIRKQRAKSTRSGWTDEELARAALEAVRAVEATSR